MKILIVNSWYPPVLTGSSLWAESLVMALHALGHDVRVVTTCWRGCPEEPEGGRKEIVYRLPAWIVPRNRFLMGIPDIPVVSSIANRRRMLEIVRKFKPDVIHQINHIFDSLFLSVYAARKTNTPLVGSITTPVQSVKLINYALMHLADLGIVYPLGVRHWKRIICADAEIARYVSETYGKRVHDRIVTGIHVGVHNRIKEREAKKKNSWPQLVMVGHVHTIRNPINLIRAMPAILERFPNAKFNIAGRIQFESPLREVKRLGLESSVRFLGLVSPERVADLVSSAHVFVILHQMKYTSISLTSFEAMQFETPVVTDAPDYLYGTGGIKNGENIILVDRDSVDDISKKIIRLLEDEKLRARIGRNGKKFVSSYLNWDICAEKTEQFYKELL